MVSQAVKRKVKMKGCVAFLVLMGSLAVGSDLKVTIVKTPIARRSINITAPPTFDTDLSVDTGFTEQTIYTSGTSQRMEFSGVPGGLQAFMNQLSHGRHYGSYQLARPHMAVITHCDSGIVDELDRHEYRQFKMPQYPDEKKFLELVGRAQRAVKNELQANTVDTGERRVIFGQTAKHLITTVSESRDAFHNPTEQLPTLLKVQVKEKVVTVVDGWYFDQPEPGCAPEYLRRNLGHAVTKAGGADLFGIQPNKDNLNEPQLSKWQNYSAYSPGMQEEIADAFPYGLREATLFDAPQNGLVTRLVYTGYLPPGLAVEQEISESGTLPATRQFPEEKHIGIPLVLKVTDFSDATLDPSLFVVPPGFKKVKVLYRSDK
jgi:hypothetical protein